MATPGNRRRFHVRESALQHTEAGDADDGFDLSRLNERHDNGGAFRHQHRIAEAFGLRLQILDRAKAALLAKKAELIERRRALALHAQALRQQQQPALRGHGREGFAPHLVRHQHANVIPVNRVALQQPDDNVRMLLELIHRHRRHEGLLGHVVADELQEVVPLHGRLRQILLRCTHPLDGHGTWNGCGSGRGGDHG